MKKDKVRIILMILIGLFVVINIALLLSRKDGEGGLDTILRADKEETIILTEDNILEAYKNVDPDLQAVAKSLIGTKVTDFEITREDGTVVLYDKSKLILSFGLSTCQACIENIKTIQVYTEQHTDTDVISIYINETESEIKDYVSEYYSEKDIVIGKNNLSLSQDLLPSIFQIKVAPTTFFIEDGIIKYIGFGSMDIDAMNYYSDIVFN